MGLVVFGFSHLISNLDSCHQKDWLAPAEILEKEMSLVGVQRPTPAWMMRNGTEFFRFGDFRGYVIEGHGG